MAIILTDKDILDAEKISSLFSGLTEAGKNIALGSLSGLSDKEDILQEGDDKDEVRETKRIYLASPDTFNMND